jgi:hypothetical protein
LRFIPRFSNARKFTPEEEELVMNLSAAYLKKQEEWKQEGEQKKAAEVAINLLREGMAPELVAKVTELPLKEIERLHSSL